MTLSKLGNGVRSKFTVVKTLNDSGFTNYVPAIKQHLFAFMLVHGAHDLEKGRIAASERKIALSYHVQNRLVWDCCHSHIHMHQYILAF
jgi:hypothetical protein